MSEIEDLINKLPKRLVADGVVYRLKIAWDKNDRAVVYYGNPQHKYAIRTTGSLRNALKTAYEPTKNPIFNQKESK